MWLSFGKVNIDVLGIFHILLVGERCELTTESGAQQNHGGQPAGEHGGRLRLKTKQTDELFKKNKQYI